MTYNDQCAILSGMVSENYLNVTQAADYIGVSRQTISKWLKSGLPYEKIGQAKLISRAALCRDKLRCPICGSMVNKWNLKEVSSGEYD